jgi:tripartite-type tricarboxylate transporter receptor subunit TctC
LFCAILLVFAGGVHAQQYAGKTVDIIVNYTAGGPTDVEARIIAQYLPKYLQGVSGVVVRNVPGGAATIGINQLGKAEGKDRYNVGFFTWNPQDQILKNPILHVKYSDFKFIAGVRQASLLYIRKDTGVTKPADIATVKQFKAGSLAPQSHGTLRQRLALDLLGANYRTIPGYKGLKQVELAVLAGDVSLGNNSLPGYISSVKHTLIDTGIAIPLLQYDRPDGLPGRSEDLPDVPTFMEVYKAVHGKDAVPSGEKWELLQFLTRLIDSLYRTMFMPPTAPAEAVAEMRAAMLKVQNDPDFIASYEKVVGAKPRFVSVAQGEKVIAGLANTKPSIVEFLKAYIDSGQ